MNLPDLEDFFPRFLAHAEANSDLDYEVGDYQDLCRAMRDVLTDEQWAAVLRSDGVRDLLDLPEFRDLPNRQPEDVADDAPATP